MFVHVPQCLLLNIPTIMSFSIGMRKENALYKLDLLHLIKLFISIMYWSVKFTSLCILTVCALVYICLCVYVPCT